MIYIIRCVKIWCFLKPYVSTNILIVLYSPLYISVKFVFIFEYSLFKVNILSEDESEYSESYFSFCTVLSKKKHMFNFLQQTCRFECDHVSENQMSAGRQENVFNNVLNSNNGANAVEVNKCSIKITSDKLLTVQVKQCKNHNDPAKCSINVLLISDWLTANMTDSDQKSINFIKKFVLEKINSVRELLNKALTNKQGFKTVINHFRTTVHKDYNENEYFDTDLLKKFIFQVESDPKGQFYKYANALKSLSAILDYLNKMTLKFLDCNLLNNTKLTFVKTSLFEFMENNIVSVETNIGTIKLHYNKTLNQAFSQAFGSNHNLQNLFRFKFLSKFTYNLFKFAFIEGQLKLSDANLFLTQKNQDFFRRCNHCIENKNMNELNIPHELATPLLGIYTLPDGYNFAANLAFSNFLSILIHNCFDEQRFPLTQQLTFKIFMLHARYFKKYLSK